MANKLTAGAALYSSFLFPALLLCRQIRLSYAFLFLPTATRQFSTHAAAASSQSNTYSCLISNMVVPELCVFDLDACFWYVHY